MKKNYDNLYLDILRLGTSKVSEGLSYNVLKRLLESKGYDFENNCIELAVKQWFYDCFHHRDKDTDPITCVHEIDDHLDCNFILKGGSALTLVEYETSRRNTKIAYFSLVVALVALLYPIYHDIYTEKECPSEKSQKVQSKTIQEFESKHNSHKNLKVVAKKSI